MADHRLTAEQVSALARGRARAEPCEDGIALVLDGDRIVLPECPNLLTAITRVEGLMGQAFNTVIETQRGRLRQQR